MKAVLDANVIIAAFAGRGLCNALLELCVANDEIILCEEILADVREKLVLKIKIPRQQAAEIDRYLRAHSTIVAPAPTPANACRDADDLPVLGAAVVAHADFLITGNEDLLTLKAYASIPIVTPRQYWDACNRPQ